MKQKIFSIGLTILSIVVIVICVVLITHRKEVDGQGTITFEVIDVDGTLLDKKTVRFEDKDSLLSLVEENYEIELMYGMIIKIDALYTPNLSKEFIKIYQNCDATTVGISSVTFEDGDIFRFVLTEFDPDGEFSDKYC